MKKHCPFCGGKTGDSDCLCGPTGNGWYWCRNVNYNTRTLPKEDITATLLQEVESQKRDTALCVEVMTNFLNGVEFHADDDTKKRLSYHIGAFKKTISTAKKEEDTKW